MTSAAVRQHLDALWESEQAQHERIQRGEDLSGIDLSDLLGTWLIDWPLPAWAKWVRWEPGESGLLEPRIGGMAFVNRAYAQRYPQVDARVYVRLDDVSMWGAQVGGDYNLADVAAVYREAGPEFWDRIGPGWWGPRYWESIAVGPGATQVDSVKSVARDRHGVIRLATGMVVNEQPGWLGRPAGRVTAKA